MIKFLDKQLLVILFNSIINFLLAGAKIVVGYLFNSQLLIADGIHSTSDLLTDIFAIIGIQIAKKPKDDSHPFGHGNLEYVSSLIVSILIFFMTYELTLEFIDNWSVPVAGISIFVFYVSLGTFIVKLLLSYYVLYQAKQLDSHTLRTSGLESLTDAYSTIILIIGLLLTNYGLDNSIGWLVYAEKIATITIILMLLKTAWSIFFSSVVGIAGAHAPEEVQEEFFNVIKHAVLQCDKVCELTEFIVLKQGLDYGIFLTLNFKSDIPLKEVENIMQDFRTMLLNNPKVQKVNIEFCTSF